MRENTIEKLGRRWWLAAVLMVVFSSLALLEAQSEEMPILVSHRSYLEGGLSRYDPEQKDWVSVEKDVPWGKGAILSSDKRGKAEFIIPNNTWARSWLKWLF